MKSVQKFLLSVTLYWQKCQENLKSRKNPRCGEWKRSSGRGFCTLPLNTSPGAASCSCWVFLWDPESLRKYVGNLFSANIIEKREQKVCKRTRQIAFTVWSLTACSWDENMVADAYTCFELFLVWKIVKNGRKDEKRLLRKCVWVHAMRSEPIKMVLSRRF